MGFRTLLPYSYILSEYGTAKYGAGFVYGCPGIEGDTTMAGLNFSPKMFENISHGYRALGHVNNLIAPNLPTKKDVVQIGDYGANNMRRIKTLRAPGADTKEIRRTFTIVDAVTLSEHAAKTLVTDEDIEDADTPAKPMKDAMDEVNDQLSIEIEADLADVMNAVGTFTNNTTLAGITQWDQAGTSFPNTDIPTAIQTVADAIGQPDSEITLFMSKEVFRVLSYHAQVLDTLGLKDERAGGATPQELARIYRCKQVIVASGQINTADFDATTPTFTSIFGLHCWALYIPPGTPTLRQKYFAFTARKRNGFVIDTERDWHRKATWVRGTDKNGLYVMEELAGYMIEDAI